MENNLMISRTELQQYAKLTALNLGQAELDYYQNIILFIISQEYSKELVFKGGTALKKCYGLDRFSEDLDFTCIKEIDTNKIFNALKRFNIEFETEIKDYSQGIKIIIRIKGPLYSGIKNSMCKMIIDLSYRENVLLSPNITNLGRFLLEVPSFDVYVMNEQEILSEKIRAIMTRDKARDVYDLDFLLKKGITINKEFIAQKMSYYNEKFDKKLFIKRLKDKKSIWLSELSPLIKSVPKFVDTENLVLKVLKKI